jgi:hypothetical protein
MSEPLPEHLKKIEQSMAREVGGCEELDKALKFLLKDVPDIKLNQDVASLTEEELDEIVADEMAMDDDGSPRRGEMDCLIENLKSELAKWTRMADDQRSPRLYKQFRLVAEGIRVSLELAEIHKDTNQ